ncbi:SDR family oxidoreductase [Exiguobacterium flavidum]|uniref:SDR family oxidoreductase n=1 Tax=Exiguobacterium flavidum TaxID=2184695 RepID=UPI000DF84C36|nr:SDR family oxidoreductase [Exiguobacterium flavidum]
MKKAIVTGVGRLDGIGAAVCRRLAQEGYDLYMTYYAPYDEKLGGAMQDRAAFETELGREGGRIHSASWDLTDPVACNRLIEDAERVLGKLSCLVHTACYSTEDDIFTVSAETLDAHYAVNGRATVLLVRAFAEQFEGSDGRIVLFTSGQSNSPMSGELSYALTKAMSETLVRTVASDLMGKGITINAINPGPTDTGWITPDFESSLRERFPSGKITQPEDAAKAVAMLLGEDASFVTGQVVHAEAGFRH